MALKVINKINSRLKFLYRKNRYLTPYLKRLLCNALIQPHFDYACSAWYPNLNKKLKSKLQTVQNRCIRYCLQLDNRTYRSQIGVKHFEKINWLPLPISERFNKYLCFNPCRFFKETCPLYFPLSYICPLWNMCSGQEHLLYLTPIVWNSLLTDLKLAILILSVC